jgi:hypothetical protein
MRFMRPEKGFDEASLCQLEPSARPRGRYEYNLNNGKIPKKFSGKELDSITVTVMIRSL